MARTLLMAERNHTGLKKDPTMTRQIAFGIAAMSLGTAAVGCAAAVWLTNDLRAFGVGIMPAGVLAAALIWYFERRTDPRRGIPADGRDHIEASEIDAHEGRIRERVRETSHAAAVRSRSTTLNPLAARRSDVRTQRRVTSESQHSV